MFTDYKALDAERQAVSESMLEEHALQQTVLALQKRFGKSVVFKGTDLQEAATTLERNAQVGGHKA